MTRGAVLCGLGTALPPRVVTNEELAARFDTSDEWIRSRTGIGLRHVVGPGTATSDLAVEAGERALKSAGTDTVDAVIVATTTPDHQCPTTAPAVAARLGLGTVAAFDLAAVCPGFLYGLVVASGLIAAGTAERILLIGADTYSTAIDPADRAGRAIFGDGAGAVVLRVGDIDEPGAVGPFDLGSDGTGSELVTRRSGGSRDPHPGPGWDPYLRMAGRAVFRNAVERMSESAAEVLRRTGWDTPDLLVAHQANLRIMQAVADRLAVPHDRCAVHLDRVGNTAAASVPLALADADAAGSLRPGDRVLLTAFGGGFTWGSGALVWPTLGTF